MTGLKLTVYRKTDKNTHMHRKKRQRSCRQTGMQSVQVSCVFVSLLIACAVQSERRASQGAEHERDSGHDSIVTITNELLTRKSGDLVPHSLCVMFALNTLISELRNRQTRNWRESRVELSQVFVGLARTSLGRINITLCLLKSLNLAN